MPFEDTHQQPLAIILDTDIGDDVDDALALVTALHSPEVEVLGVTTVFRDAPKRAILAREVLRRLGRDDVPVFAGCSEPILANWEAIQEGRKLGRQFEALDPHLKWEETRHAVSFLIDTVRERHERGQKVTVVTIGALTNLAIAFRLAPDIIEKCDVVMMGGRHEIPYGEWNIICDPEAAAMVFASGATLKMVGLDVTLQCVLSDDEVRQFHDSPHEHARFSGQLIDLWGHKVTLHDPLTILTLFSDVVTFEPMRLEVQIYGGEKRIYTTRVEGEPNVLAATSVDAEKAKALFLERTLQAPR